MPYLLDGNNLVGSVRRTSRPSPEDRAALIADVADRLRRTKARAILYFDGPAGERESALGGLTVRTPASGSADDAILRAVAASRSPRECIVVTGDRGLLRRARDAGAQVASPPDFFARFGAPGKSSDPRHAPPATAQELDEWMRYFEDERNRD